MLLNRDRIADGLRACRETPGAVLFDVRDAQEYAQGHIPGAVHMTAEEIIIRHPGRDTPMFLYCLRGIRSRRAAWKLRKAGYTHVKSIGGIRDYKGPLESGKQ